MGKSSSAKQDGDRRGRIAAQRAAHQRAQTRNRLLIAGGAVVVVVAVVLALVMLRGSGGGSGRATDSGSPGPTGASLAALAAQVTSVPATVLDQVGGGQA